MSTTRQINALWRAQTHGGSYPSLLIRSVDLKAMLDLVAASAFTMQGRFYPDVCGRAGIKIVIPRPDERTYIHDKYLSELIPGRIVPATRERLLTIIRRVMTDEGIGAVILGGTELPLLLSDDSLDGVPVLDTTAIHVRRIVEELTS